MRIEITEALWLEARDDLTLDQLAESSGLPPALLQQLVELDALPAPAAATRHFGADCLDIAQVARRLRSDLELDNEALAVVLRLLRRIHTLEAELRALQAQFPRRPL